jgi:hypothetical protein
MNILSHVLNRGNISSVDIAVKSETDDLGFKGRKYMLELLLAMHYNFWA